MQRKFVVSGNRYNVSDMSIKTDVLHTCQWLYMYIHVLVYIHDESKGSTQI